MGHAGVHNVINHDADERCPRAAPHPGEGVSMISRRVQIATLGVVTGVLAVSGGLTGAALAETHGYHLLGAARPCASRAAATARVVSLVTTNSPALVTDTPTPTPAPTDSSAATTSPPPTSAPAPAS